MPSSASPTAAGWRRQAPTGTPPPMTSPALPSSASAAFSSVQATPSSTPPSNNNNAANGFYQNQLFYILIAVLGAFAFVSAINLMRTRRRRRMILREAERLGLMVPGMPGYIPMRERAVFVKADGWRTPDWWEVEPDKGAEGTGAAGTDASAGGADGSRGVTETKDVSEVEHVETANRSGAEPPDVRGMATVAEKEEEQAEVKPQPSTRLPVSDFGARGRLELPDVENLHPLGLVPQPILVNEPPKPWSPIPYFPNYVSYLRSAHDPHPPRFDDEDPHAFDSLAGDEVQVIVALRMPTRPLPPAGNPADDDDAVIREWHGLELGITNMAVHE